MSETAAPSELSRTGPVPVRVCSTEEEALAFAREAHERIARREESV